MKRLIIGGLAAPPLAISTVFASTCGPLQSRDYQTNLVSFIA